MYAYESAFDLAKTIIIIVSIFATFGFVIDLIDKKTEQEIVKKTDDYMVFEKCIEVEDNWYCKKEND